MKFPKKVSRWKGLVQKYAGRVIPVSFGLTMIAEESAGDPQAVSQTGARGLMQITGNPLRSFNEALGTNYSRGDLFDPNLNVMIGMSLLKSIVQTWKLKHPETLSPDWRDPDWVTFLVWAWNVGSFERSGVGYVVGTMERGGVPPSQITPDTVFQAAQNLPQAGKWLKVPKRLAWAKKVARSYVRGMASKKEPSQTKVWPWLLGGGILAGAGYMLFFHKGGGGSQSLSLSPEQIGILKGMG